MGVFDWFGRTVTPRDGGFWTMFFGQETWSGKRVTPDGALELAAVWSCVRLIAETVATLPIGVFERGADGSKRPATGHPLYAILHDTPNADQTAVEFWEAMTGALCLQGNSFAEKKLSGETLIALDALDARCVRPIRKDGRLVYSVEDRGKKEELPEAKVFHVKGFGLGGDLGLSPIAYARQTLGIAMAAEESAGRTFGNGARPSGFLTVDKVLKQDQRDSIQQRIVDPITGAGNVSKIGILEAGMEWVQVGLSPQDTQMLLSRKWHVEEICRWFRTPPMLIGHAGEGQTMWGSGVEQIMIGWLTLGLRTYLKRFESAISKRLIAPAERGKIFAEFNVEGLLRADSKGRAEFYSKMVQNAGLTPNEIRAAENKSPMAGGDKLLINSTLIPLDMAGQVRPAAPAPEKIP